MKQPLLQPLCYVSDGHYGIAVTMVYASALVGREGEGYIYLNYESDRAAHTLDFIIVYWFCGDGKSTDGWHAIISTSHRSTAPLDTPAGVRGRVAVSSWRHGGHRLLRRPPRRRAGEGYYPFEVVCS